MERLIETLHREKCSCVISCKGKTILCHGRGVKDLYELLLKSPDTLAGAMIADKVVGKGAAALMIAGGVSQVYADVISQPALKLFESSGVSVNYDLSVANIINRNATAICPVETLCAQCATADECIPLIENFLRNNASHT